ncbi:MAG: carboxypeptidase-like regulatory domain-containing protein [Acidobacteriia bacterium]|nr:carboxypeptidase-like regulatory domain-containing protein [Terriglobia bacterium]
MSKRRVVCSVVSIALVLACVCLCSAFAVAEAATGHDSVHPPSIKPSHPFVKNFFPPGENQPKPGAPLKGADVKLGKNPGGQAAARTTDSEGHFDFGVLPKGSYYLTFSYTSSSKGEPSGSTSRHRGIPTVSELTDCPISISGPVGGPVNARWNFQNNKAIPSAQTSTARGEAEDKIIFESDGQHPISGFVQVKSKSNITNN